MPRKKVPKKRSDKFVPPRIATLDEAGREQLRAYYEAMPSPIKGMPARWWHLAAMLGDGYARVDACELLQIKYRDSYRWEASPKFQEAKREAAMRKIYQSAVRALLALDKQIDSDDPWIVQGAAREMLNRGLKYVLGESEAGGGVQVIFDSSVPVPGMPQAITGEIAIKEESKSDCANCPMPIVADGDVS